jgi:hypothetical protein
MSPRDEHDPVPSWDEVVVNFARRMAPARVEPSAEIREAARSLMELFTGMQEAGFTETQAMKIVLETIHVGRRGGQ